MSRGKILIGDVAFDTRSELEQCRRDAGDEWDGGEIYFVADELREHFPPFLHARLVLRRHPGSVLMNPSLLRFCSYYFCKIPRPKIPETV